jgi:hypothetical protein
VEGVWQKAIKDFENNKLSSKYIGPKIDLEHFKIIPRRDLLHSNYLWQSVQTSRGCLFYCEFCSVSRDLGKTYRCRRAEDVVELAAKAGCMFVFIVFETISLDTLKGMQKGVNIKTGVNNYKEFKRMFALTFCRQHYT